MENQLGHRQKTTLVLMAGLPGAGKTTLAYGLSRELQWQVIDKDQYRVQLLKLGWSDEDASTAAYERAFDQLRRALLEEQISVIFDTAALHRFILDNVKEIVHKATDAQLKVILCVVDRDVRNYRLRTRPCQYTNIRVDPTNIADYLRYFKHLPEDKLTLFTSPSYEECLAKALKYIKS